MFIIGWSFLSLLGPQGARLAGNNEIDKPLLALLQQNIDAARAAGQIDPAVFMEKVRDAARKYVLAS